MNDEEINEIIARNDQESITFREMDIQRERETAEKWKAAGNRGKPPPPLMQLEELPECYRTDEPFGKEDELDEVEGRGQRRRTVVNYNDGLDDDTWAMVSSPLLMFIARLSLTDSYFCLSCRLWKTGKTSKSWLTGTARNETDARRTSWLGKSNRRPCLMSILLAVDGKARKAKQRLLMSPSIFPLGSESVVG